MHSLDRQLRSSLRFGIALAVLLMIFATPSAMALVRGIGGVPPAPASRTQSAERRSGELPPLTSLRGVGP